MGAVRLLNADGVELGMVAIVDGKLTVVPPRPRLRRRLLELPMMRGRPLDEAWLKRLPLELRGAYLRGEYLP